MSFLSFLNKFYKAAMNINTTGVLNSPRALAVLMKLITFKNKNKNL